MAPRGRRAEWMVERNRLSVQLCQEALGAHAQGAGGLGNHFLDQRAGTFGDAEGEENLRQRQLGAKRVFVHIVRLLGLQVAAGARIGVDRQRIHVEVDHAAVGLAGRRDRLCGHGRGRSGGQL